MQLIRRPRRALAAATALAVLAAASPALADGSLTMRGAYYKERSTRVAQPMIDADLDAGEHGTARGHVLVDSITSASVAAGASGEPFTETRVEGGAGYAHEVGRFRLGGDVRVSREPDYLSVFATLTGRAELAQRNTRITTSIAQGHDQITNEGARGEIGQPIEGSLDTTLASVSVSQILSPLMLAAVTYDAIVLDGYQENPYRQVAAGGALVPERVPDLRFRNALAVSVRRFVPVTRSTVVARYRLYADDWGVVGHTPELRVIQDLTAGISARLRYRYYEQTGADFYRDVYDTAAPQMEPYLTSDAKLGPMTTHTFGLKLSSPLAALGLGGAYADFRAEALLEYVRQNTHYGDAVVAQMALTVPFEY